MEELIERERGGYHTLEQRRSRQRRILMGWADGQRLENDIVDLTDQYGPYGKSMVSRILHNSDWHVNHKSLERICGGEGLQARQE